jgi:serine phosphatase RsbU (regulator of sigma subunit)
MMRHSQLRTGFMRGAGALTAVTILAFAVIVAVAGAWNTRSAVNASFAEQLAIQRGQFALEEMLKLQLDEENYVRAYVITRDRSYIDAYRATTAHFESVRGELYSVLTRERLPEAVAALSAYDRAHSDWHREVAHQILLNGSAAAAGILDLRGKNLTDLQQQAASDIEERLSAKNREAFDATQHRINATLYSGTIALFVFGVLAMLFFGWRFRATSALEEERLTTQTLQRAFKSEHVPLPNCDIGSAYGAASSHLAVGGDVFDVHRLSDRLGLVLIADVSGKGVDAAVLTAFIKFTIRGIALRRRDPGFILQEFNRAFPRTVENPYLFVSMLVGILDTWALRFDYASAGHDIAFLRRSSSVEQLAVTGPVLGVMEEDFGVRTIHLEEGDTIVLSTDGLTESRDGSGRFLETQGAMEWIREGPAAPDELAAYLIGKARERSGTRMRDDVAVLAIRIESNRA